MARTNIDIALKLIGDRAVVEGFKAAGGAAETAVPRVRKLTRELELTGTASIKVAGLLRSAAGILAGAFAGISAGAAIRKVITETVEAQKAFSQLEAGVRSTGGAARLTAGDLAGLASDLQLVSTYEDEAIAGAESLLLTFTKIKGDVFKRATRDVIDLATRLDGDLAGAARMVGKALQQPATGLTALERAIGKLDPAFKTMIKNLVDSGQGVQAQNLLLAELEKRVGGSAKALRDTLGGSLHVLKVSVGELAESIGAGLTPAMRQISEEIAKALSDPAFRKDAEALGKAIGEGLVIAAKAVVEIGEALAHLPEILEEIWRLAVAIGIAFTAWKIAAGTQALAAFAKGATAAEIAGYGLIKSLAAIEISLVSLRAGFAKLTAYLAANPYILLAAALAGVAYGMQRWIDKIGEQHDAMLDQLALIDRTRIAKDMLAAATHRMTEEEHKYIGAQLQSLIATLAATEAKIKALEAKSGKVQDYGGIGGGPARFIAQGQNEELRDLRGQAGETKRLIAELQKSLQDYASGAWKIVPPIEPDEWDAAGEKLKEFLETLRELRLSIHQKAEQMALFRMGADDEQSIKALAKAHELEAYAAEQTIKFGAIRAAQLVELKRQELGLVDVIEKAAAAAAAWRKASAAAGAGISEVIAELGKGSGGASAKEIAKTLLEADSALSKMESTIKELIPHGATYEKRLKEINEAKRQMIGLSAGLVEAVKRERAEMDAEARAAASRFSLALRAMRDHTAALLKGGTALRDYNRDLAITAESLRMVADLRPFLGEGPEEFGRRWLEAVAQARETIARDIDAEIIADLRVSLITPKQELAAFANEMERLKRSGLSAAEAEELLRRRTEDLGLTFNQVAQGVLSGIQALLDTFASIGGMGDRAGFRAVQEGIASIQKVFTAYDQAKAVAARFTDNAGTIAGIGAMGATITAFAVVYDQIDKYLKRRKAKTYKNAAEVTTLEGEFGISAVSKDALAVVGVLKKMITDVLDAIDGFGATLPKIGIKIRNDGKKVEAYLAGALIGVFDSVEEAISQALAGALKAGDIKGISPEVKAVLKNTLARTMEELGEQLDFAVRVSRMGIHNSALELRDIIEQTLEDLFKGLELGLDPSSIQKILSQGGTSIQAMLDDLYSVQKSEHEQRMEQGRAIQAEIEARRAAIQAQIAEIEAKIAGVKATMGLAAASAAMVAAFQQQIAALEEILKSLIDVDFGKIKGRKGGRGGGGATRGDAAGFVRDLLQGRLGEFGAEVAGLNERFAEATKGLGDYDKAMRDAAKRRDEAIKAAKGNEEAIKKANEAYRKAAEAAGKDRDALAAANQEREKEMALISARARAALIAPYLGGLDTGVSARSDFAGPMAEILKAFEDLRTVAGPLKLSLEEINRAETVRLQLLGMEAAASLGIASAQIHLALMKVADTLAWMRENADKLGISAEEFGRIVAETSQKIALDAVGSIEKYITDEETLARLAEIRYDMEKANALLQLNTAKALGLILQADYDWAMGIIGALPPDLATPGGGRSKADARAAMREKMSQRVDEVASELERLRDALRDAKDSIRKTLDEFDRGAFGGVTPQAALAAARAQFEAALSGGKAGDLASLQAAPEAFKNLLDVMKGFSPALFATESPELRNKLESLLGVNTIRQGNLVMTDFVAQQRHKETVSTLNSGFDALSSQAAQQTKIQQDLRTEFRRMSDSQNEFNARLARLESGKAGNKREVA